MANDLAPLADAAPLAPLSPEEIAELLADAPWPEPISEAEIDAMYADWCARNNIDVDASGHKDHHYWVAA